MTAVATGRRLDWLEGREVGVATAVRAETSGPGDDIQVELTDGHVLEVQVKHGLTKSARLWDALETLAQGLTADPELRAILLVSPDSSSTIRRDLANDLARMASGRTDGLKAISREFAGRLEDRGLCAEETADRLRIVTLDPDHARQTMRRDLEDLCATPAAARAAAFALENDAAHLIERRGRRDLRTIVQTLDSAEIAWRLDASARAATLARPQLGRVKRRPALKSSVSNSRCPSTRDGYRSRRCGPMRRPSQSTCPKQ